MTLIDVTVIVDVRGDGLDINDNDDGLCWSFAISFADQSQLFTLCHTTLSSEYR